MKFLEKKAEIGEDFNYFYSYVEMSEEEYHMQMATKDWTTIMSFPMVVLAIQVLRNILFLDCKF